jgi:hypothetical protein
VDRVRDEVRFGTLRFGFEKERETTVEKVGSGWIDIGGADWAGGGYGATAMGGEDWKDWVRWAYGAIGGGRGAEFHGCQGPRCGEGGRGGMKGPEGGKGLGDGRLKSFAAWSSRDWAI